MAITVVVVLAALAWWLLGSAQPSGKAPTPELSRSVATVPLPVAEDGTPQPLGDAPADAVVLPASGAGLDPAVNRGEGVLFGRVQDPDGVPISGARLELFRVDVSWWPEQEPLASATTDVEGRFVLPDLPPVVSQIATTAEGHAPDWLDLEDVDPDRALVITLDWRTTLFGQVRDAETELPLEGVRVFVTLYEEGHEAVLSDANGRYRITDIPTWSDLLRAHRDGYVPAAFDLTLDGSDDVELDVELRRGEGLPVTVVDRDTGESLAGVQLRHHAHEPAYATSDERGRLTIFVQPGGEQTVHLSREGYCDLVWRRDGEHAPPAPPLVFSLRGLAWIEGQVTDPRGEPIHGAEVFGYTPDQLGVGRRPRSDAHLPGRLRDEAHEVAHTDRSGGFTLPVVPASAPYELRVSAPEYATTRSALLHLEQAGDRAWVEMVCQRGATIHGRILVNGEPWRRGTWVGALDARDERLLSSSAGLAGTYRLSGLPAEEVRVQLHLRDELADEVAFTLEAGQIVEHDFEREEQRGTISGQVLWATEEEPAVGVRVTARPGGPDGWRYETHALVEDDGRYTLDVLAGFVYDVRARDITVRSVHAGTVDVDFVLPRPGTLRLRLVEAATGDPVVRFKEPRPRVPWNHPGEDTFRTSWAWLSWRRPGEAAFSDQHARLEPGGLVEVVLPAGLVDLSLQLGSEGYRPKLLTNVLVSADPDVPPIEVALQRGPHARLRLREATSGEPPPADVLLMALADDQLALVRGPFDPEEGRANIVVEPRTHRSHTDRHDVHLWIADPGLLHQNLRWDAAGVAELRGLEPGRYHLRAYPDSLVFAPATFTVPSPGDVPLDVRWSYRTQ